jgi:hypothetical protein
VSIPKRPAVRASLTLLVLHITPSSSERYRYLSG